MKKLIFTLLLFFTTAGFSLLSPYHQTVKELTTILNSEELHKKLGSSQSIKAFFKSQSGWDLATQKYQIHVEVEYLPTKKIGPLEFKLHFSDPIIINKFLEN